MAKLSSKFKFTAQEEAVLGSSSSKKPAAKAKTDKKQAKEES